MESQNVPNVSELAKALGYHHGQHCYLEQQIVNEATKFIKHMRIPPKKKDTYPEGNV